MPRPETANKAAIKLPPISRPDPLTVEEIFGDAYRRSNMGELPITYTPREKRWLEHYSVFGKGQPRIMADIALALSRYSRRNS